MAKFISHQKTVVLFDASYVQHYCANVAHKWHKDQNFTIPGKVREYDFTYDAEYMAFFKNYVFSKFNDVISENNFGNLELVLAFDCPKTQIWRREIYPEYKLHRITKVYKDTDPNFGTVFKHFETVIAPMLAEQHKIKIIKFPTCEADDIIATISMRLKDDETTVKILGRDQDYHQLICDNLSVMDFSGTIFNVNNTDPKKVLQMKVIAGDRGDNVPGIHFRCGDTTAEKYINDKSLLMEKLKNPDTERQFRINKMLVDFREIPKDLQEQIMKEYNNG